MPKVQITPFTLHIWKNVGTSLTPENDIALLNMADRTGLEPIRRMATSLVQSLQYGTPLTQVLRCLATVQLT